VETQGTITKKVSFFKGNVLKITFYRERGRAVRAPGKNSPPYEGGVALLQRPGGSSITF
jgi:hypothetical protein